MTLEQLKAILDDGWVIERGNERIWSPFKYRYHTHPDIGEKSYTWDEIKTFIPNPSEWQEVKAEALPESSGVSEALGEMNAYIAEVMRQGGYKLVEKREWDALQKELEELRAKANSTFDAPTEYEKQRKDAINSAFFRTNQ